MRIYTDRTVDAEFKDLGDLGFTGALNDRQFAFLRDAGYTNSLADMMYQHRSGGGLRLLARDRHRGHFDDQPLVGQAGQIARWTLQRGSGFGCCLFWGPPPPPRFPPSFLLWWLDPPPRARAPPLSLSRSRLPRRFACPSAVFWCFRA